MSDDDFLIEGLDVLLLDDNETVQIRCSRADAQIIANSIEPHNTLAALAIRSVANVPRKKAANAG